MFAKQFFYKDILGEMFLNIPKELNAYHNSFYVLKGLRLRKSSLCDSLTIFKHLNFILLFVIQEICHIVFK